MFLIFLLQLIEKNILEKILNTLIRIIPEFFVIEVSLAL